jgi:hypothetical protein
MINRSTSETVEQVLVADAASAGDDQPPGEITGGQQHPVTSGGQGTFYYYRPTRLTHRSGLG